MTLVQRVDVFGAIRIDVRNRM